MLEHYSGRLNNSNRVRRVEKWNLFCGGRECAVLPGLYGYLSRAEVIAIWNTRYLLAA